MHLGTRCNAHALCVHNSIILAAISAMDAAVVVAISTIDRMEGGSHDDLIAPTGLSLVLSRVVCRILTVLCVCAVYVANRISVNPSAVAAFYRPTKSPCFVFFLFYTSPLFSLFLDRGARLCCTGITRSSRHDAIITLGGGGGCPRPSSLPYNNNLCYYMPRRTCVPAWKWQQLPWDQ